MTDEERRKLYGQVFGSDVGKDVLVDLMAQFHVFSTSNVRGDAHETAYNEGERNVVLFILNTVRPRPVVGERGRADEFAREMTQAYLGDRPSGD